MKQSTAKTQQIHISDFYTHAAPKMYGPHITLLPYSVTEVKNALFAMKYEQDTHSVRLFAQLLKDFLKSEIEERETFSRARYQFYVVPITETRKTKNKYHHLHLLLNEVLRDMEGEDRRNALFWNRKVERQSTLKTKQQRKQNVMHAVSLEESISPNTVCILIDDIVTTGFTLNECRRVLQEHGAKDVISVALAH